MIFDVETMLECANCSHRKTYNESYAAEDFEDFKPEEFEDAAIDWFKNHEWKRVGVTDKWLCSNCKEIECEFCGETDPQKCPHFGDHE